MREVGAACFVAQDRFTAGGGQRYPGKAPAGPESGANEVRSAKAAATSGAQVH